MTAWYAVGPGSNPGLSSKKNKIDSTRNLTDVIVQIIGAPGNYYKLNESLRFRDTDWIRDIIIDSLA